MFENPYARTNRVYPNSGRQAIARKLNQIVFDTFEASDLVLMEVVKRLSQQSRERDPEGTGVNFIISPFADAPLSIAAPSAPRIQDFSVTIKPPLRNARLVDVLDAITRVAVRDAPADPQFRLTYSIEDYAVVFAYRRQDSEPLYTRTYKVDPNTFIQGLDPVFLQRNPFNQTGAGGHTTGQTAGGVGPGGYFQFVGSVPGESATGARGGGGIIGVTVTNAMSTIQDAVRNFFIAAGIDFRTNQQPFEPGGFGGQPPPPQKAIYFNDRRGVLLVRATLRDLDIIEEALQVLNVPAPQVQMKIEAIKLKNNDDLEAVKKALEKVQGKIRSALMVREFQQFKWEALNRKLVFVPMRKMTTLSGRSARSALDAGIEMQHSVEVLPRYLERNSSFHIEATSIEFDRETNVVRQTGTVYDGQTFVLLPTSIAAGEPPYIIFITPELVNTAGDRVFTPDE